MAGVDNGCGEEAANSTFGGAHRWDGILGGKVRNISRNHGPPPNPFLLGEFVSVIQIFELVDKERVPLGAARRPLAVNYWYSLPG